MAMRSHLSKRKTEYATEPSAFQLLGQPSTRDQSMKSMRSLKSMRSPSQLKLQLKQAQTYGYTFGQMSVYPSSAAAVNPSVASEPAAAIQRTPEQGVAKANELSSGTFETWDDVMEAHNAGAINKRHWTQIMQAFHKGATDNDQAASAEYTAELDSIPNVHRAGPNFEKLLAQLDTARRSQDPQVKLDFLTEFSQTYAPHLTGEIEFFQFLSTGMAYLSLKKGDSFAANIDTQNVQKSKVDEMIANNAPNAATAESQQQTDSASNYASNYEVAETYHHLAGLNAFLILPTVHQMLPTENAIVLFRGTDLDGRAVRKAEGQAMGVLADTDVSGVGKTAFNKGLATMKRWLKIVDRYPRITIAGHSLGGALAERFYALASQQCPEKLRLITNQGAAIDRLTTAKTRGQTDPQRQGAKVTHVVGRGDIVPYSGSAHVPGQKLKYSGDYGTAKSHTQMELAKQQINEALDAPFQAINNVIVTAKTGGTNLAKATLTLSKNVLLGAGLPNLRNAFLPTDQRDRPTFMQDYKPPESKVKYVSEQD